jgi:hypothetical protein
MDKLLDELGADFKAAWETAGSIDPTSDDGKVLDAALGPVYNYSHAPDSQGPKFLIQG